MSALGRVESVHTEVPILHISLLGKLLRCPADLIGTALCGDIGCKVCTSPVVDAARVCAAIVRRQRPSFLREAGQNILHGLVRVVAFTEPSVLRTLIQNHNSVAVLQTNAIDATPNAELATDARAVILEAPWAKHLYRADINFEVRRKCLRESICRPAKSIGSTCSPSVTGPNERGAMVALLEIPRGSPDISRSQQSITSASVQDHDAVPITQVKPGDIGECTRLPRGAGTTLVETTNVRKDQNSSYTSKSDKCVAKRSAVVGVGVPSPQVS